jgi:hypothetical protein
LHPLAAGLAAMQPRHDPVGQPWPNDCAASSHIP